jgi:hypothetical protein
MGMTATKAQELSLSEWYELLAPYGWADITTRSVAVTLRGYSPGILEWEIRVLLRPGSELTSGEWAERSHLLEQARQAVEAVRGKGYVLRQPPRIEFGGDYMDPGPMWVARAELHFSVWDH